MLKTCTSAALCFLTMSTAATPVYWAQFRGPNGSGVASDATPPVEFGPQKNLLWKTAVPPGVSSPCIWGDRIFLTAFESGKLETICIERSTGAILWRKNAPADKIERVHSFSSPASSTPAADSERVYVYFASYGLLCYNHEGRELWNLPLPIPQNEYGASTSPILAGEFLILLCDGNGGSSYLLAVDSRTGKTGWKKDRAVFRAGWSTPMIWRHDGEEELIALGSGRLISYDLKDGSERWWVSGFPSPITVPVAGDGVLFASASGFSGDPEDHVEFPKWDDLAKECDKNKDGKLTPDEFPKGFGVQLRKEVPKETPGNVLSASTLIRMLDRNKDGAIGQFEWVTATVFMAAFQDTLVAIRPGGKEDATVTHVAWREKRGVPEIPSPIYYNGRLYLVRNGGIASCYEPETGRLLYRERLGAIGHYCASLVAAAGNIYASSEPGTITVFKAADTVEIVARNEIDERIIATPAIVDKRIYVRTVNHMYAFGE